MARADFTHEITEFNGFPVIKIEDLNLGNMSVTNDIENVVRDIETMEKIDASKHIIVYKDSDEMWDGWDAINSSYVPLQKMSYSEAIARYIQLTA